MTNESKSSSYDIVIVGGGMVGASLACSLGKQPLRIAIIEAAVFQTASQPNYDDRAIALSYGTQQIFQSIGVWPLLADKATPIKHIHVSERGTFGVTRLHHHDEGVDALGYVCTAREIGQALITQLANINNVEVISPAQLIGIQERDDHLAAQIQFNDQVTTLNTKLLVAADGGQSSSRELAGIQAQHIDYHQSAVIANITTQRPHNHIAYERFTPHGPIALLPMSDNRCAVVWTHPSQAVDTILGMSDAEFLNQLQQLFGARLGQFVKVGKRAAYPLHLVKAKEQIRQRIALIGNAAHTLHPIAGQGFNLGLRDVAALAQVIVDARKDTVDFGDLATLNNYAKWREADHKRIIGFTDNLVRLFSNQLRPLQISRTTGLLAMDLLPQAKHLLAKHTMGIAGKLPRLARGLPL